jgi:hypothetical protein
MNPDTILRKEDCEVARTAEELIAWIESVHAQFDAGDATRNYARMGKGFTKPFLEEIMPLGHLAHHKYLEQPGLNLRPKIGNQNYDAEIIDTSSGDENIARVEFVSTYRDHDLALRLEYLGQHGGVFMTGPPAERDGTKASGGQVYVVPGCEDHQRRLDDLVASIEDRIADKLGKPYPADTIIAVVFDDYILDPVKDLSQLQLYFRDTLSKQALGKFCGLFILGASGRTFWEFGETAPAHLTR